MAYEETSLLFYDGEPLLYDSKTTWWDTLVIAVVTVILQLVVVDGG